jgi:hypothetical protein
MESGIKENEDGEGSPKVLLHCELILCFFNFFERLLIFRCFRCLYFFYLHAYLILYLFQNAQFLGKEGQKREKREKRQERQEREGEKGQEREKGQEGEERETQA